MYYKGLLMIKKWRVVLLSLTVFYGTCLVAMEKPKRLHDRQVLNSSAELKKTQARVVVAANNLLSSTERLEKAMVRDYGIPSSQGNSPESWMQSSNGGFHDVFFQWHSDCP
jgi:hypothetical protein